MLRMFGLPPPARGGGIFLALLASINFGISLANAAEPGWAHYGGDPGGQRYSAARQITPSNVHDLAVTWSYSTGDLAANGDAIKRA